MAEQKEQSNEKWEVLYWGLRNRGNWLRFLMQEAGVEWIDTKVSGANADTHYFRNISDGKANPQNDFLPAMAPPAIRKGDFFLNQSEVCINYLAAEFKLLPVANTEEDSKRQALYSQQLLGNCNDLCREIYDQRGKDEQSVKAFFEGDGQKPSRFQKWLTILETPLKVNNKEDTNEVYYFNQKFSYIDLMVFNVFEGLSEHLGKKFDEYTKAYPMLVKHFNCIAQRDSVKTVLAKQKELKYEWFSGQAFLDMQKQMGFV